ncbi:MAG: transketolase [Thermoleophilaceae bacterium]|nr:transketolase [Thermoleophilaceae bacterium]
MTATTTETRTLDELCVNTIRTLSMDAVQKANSGHPGTAMSLAHVTYTLYTKVMNHSPSNPDWPDRDRFVLSCGHASMLLYSTLFMAGYEGVTLEDLENFRQLDRPTAGHPEYGDAGGIETTTGPLGQGISNAVGLALGERMMAARYNEGEHEIVNHFTYTIASDGDLEEGISGEASSLAGHLGLGRLIAFYDDNHISIEGDTELAFSEDVAGRYESYGWHVQNLGEDNGIERVEDAIANAKHVTDRPSLIILRTHIAVGAPNAQDTKEAHGAPLGDEEVKLTKEAYGWPTEPAFLVPDEAFEHWRECIPRGKESEKRWDHKASKYAESHPEKWAEFERQVAGTLPEGWDSDTPKFEAGEDMATRKAGHKVLQWAASKVPELVGGSADLAPSTLTDIEDAGSVENGTFGGRNLHFGIREHAMGAIVNGLNLHYFRAYGSTFLIFSDYMKGAIRLSALMKLPSITVFTHDSIGLGEDGPTHQSVEQLVHLRATPNLRVVRPADANETALAWRYAIRLDTGPTALALSRQGLPVIDPAKVPDDAIERGAYVLEDPEGGEPDLILMSSGSEVPICMAAAEALETDGAKVRVVSAPCLDTFTEQDQAYRDSILPPSVKARLAVEAASPMSWYRWVGDGGDVLGMTTFGASGPYKDVYEKFGFTPENVVKRAKALTS